MVLLRLTTIIACFASHAAAVASPSLHDEVVVDDDTEIIDDAPAQDHTAFEDIAALLEEEEVAPKLRFLKTEEEKAERRVNISMMLAKSSGVAPIAFSDKHNKSATDFEIGEEGDEDDDNLEQTENCGAQQGKWMGPTVDSPAQKAAVKDWKNLPPIKYSKMRPKIGIVMMIYHTIVFSKAWQTLLEEKKVPFSMLIHSKETPQIPEFFEKYLYDKKLANDRCTNSKMMLMLMKHLVEKDQEVSHLAVVSGDTLPIKPLSHMTRDLSTESCSRFCADPEWKRAETYFVMRRDHALFLNKNMDQLFKLIPQVDSNPLTDCMDEDMFYWPLSLRKHSAVCNSCSMMTDWTGTDKYWQKNARNCNCPGFLKSKKDPGSCARPSLFRDVTFLGLDQLLSSQVGYWFARKFPGDGIAGAATYNDKQTTLDMAVQKLLESMRSMPVMPLMIWDFHNPSFL